MAISEYPDLPNYSSDYPSLLRGIINVVRGIMQGKSNNIHEITLLANAASTTVSLAQGDIGPNSMIVFAPQTTQAATEFGAGTMFVSAINIDASAGTYAFTITHVNNAEVSRIFKFAIFG